MNELSAKTEEAVQKLAKRLDRTEDETIFWAVLTCWTMNNRPYWESIARSIEADKKRKELRTCTAQSVL